MSETQREPGPASLRLFGAVAYKGPDGAPRVIASRRGRAVLAYIALQDEASRSRLAGMFWSDRGEAQARASLRQCLLELRIAIGRAPLHIDRETVRLQREQLRVDVAELEAALASGDADAIEGCLDQIGAERLIDEPAVTDLHQDWLDQTRERLERRLTYAIHDVLASFHDANWPGVRRLADAFLRRQPLDEVVVAAAMDAEAALGMAAQAVLRHSVLKAALARELGVEPGTGVQEALRRVVERATLKVPLREPSTSPAATSPPLLVVAAFEADISGGDVVEAVREEVLAGLSRFRDLSLVTDRRPARDVETQAWLKRDDAYLLSGALRGSGAERRLIIQLTQLGERRLIWSERSNIDLADPGDAIDRVVARTLGAVLPTITTDLQPRLRTDAGAYGRYLLARAAAARVSDFADAERAAAGLEALIAEAPTSVFAYLPLARLYNTDFGYTRAMSSTEALRDRAFELTRCALDLDRRHVHAYSVMGWCFLWRKCWDAAANYFEQAEDLNPYNAERLMEIGFGLLFLGELGQARTLLERCLIIHPTPSDGFFMDLGLLELLEGRFDEAEVRFDMVAKPTIFDDIYAAVNGVLAGRASAARMRRARQRIAAIWPPGEIADPAAMTRWFANHHPFASEMAGRPLLTGFRQMIELA